MHRGLVAKSTRRGIADVVEAVEANPVVGNGDVRTLEDVVAMRQETGCAAVAIGRGAMLDPWIFRKVADMASRQTPREPTGGEKLTFLRSHFERMVEQHGNYGCRLFRKFAAWYGVQIGIPEDLEDALRRIDSPDEFEATFKEISARQGERQTSIPTAFVKTPNGPNANW